MARILIVEDQKIMQKYFEFIILQDPDLKLVDTISDAHEAVKICNYSVIDLVLMDVQTFHNHDGLVCRQGNQRRASWNQSTHCNFSDRS